MADDKKEWISALADGELNHSALGKAIEELRGSSDMQASWSRYHLIRDTLHGNLEHGVDTELHSRISEALEQEPVVLAPKRGHRPWLRHAAGLAVAASVTGVAVLGIQQMNSPESGAKPVATMAEVVKPENFARLERPVDTAAANGDNDNLAPYLVNHNEYSLNSGMHGMLPYVRIVGHKSGE